MVKFTNFTERLRYRLENVIDYIYKNTSSVKADNILLLYFDRMKRENYKFYSHLVGLLAADHFKNLKDLKKMGLNKVSDDIQYGLYLDLYDNAGIMEWVDNNPRLIFKLLYQMSVFNSGDYFTKREQMVDCKENFDLLKRFSAFHIFDCLYYLQKYDLDMLRDIFKDDINSSDTSKEEALSSVIYNIDNLKRSDIHNYEELISQILVEYYIIANYQLTTIKDRHLLELTKEIINLIECSSYEQILEKIHNNNYLIYILYQIIDFNIDSINTNNQNSNYQKTLEKLRNKKGKM